MEERKPTRAALSEARETGCSGLLFGIAKTLNNHKEVHADEVTKDDGPFYCPDCYSDAIIRKCRERIDHFAHVARLSPDAGSVESELHKQCKEEIWVKLKERFPNGRWEKERPVKHCYKNEKQPRRPDVSGYVGQQRLVIEVQASSLSLTEIIKRVEAYSHFGCAILWVVPLRADLGTEDFRPRLYERYLHSLYYGRTYYWQVGQGLNLTPVHYGVAYRHIEYQSWYEKGEERSAGGYDKPFKIIKKPMAVNRINIAEDFKNEHRNKFTPHNERKAIPECVTWQDKLAHWWNTEEEKKFKDEASYSQEETEN